MATPPEPYAAIDLGSNSFHMVVASAMEGRMQIVDKLKDPVRIAGGLDDKRKLSDEAMTLALDCLQKFGQRIKEIPAANIRAVGTNTLRQAKNSSAFLKKAKQALGHPIEIISGREEARLIFLGVAYSNYNDKEQRLVVDIGGGSTELAIGRGYHSHLLESLYMGCVNMSNRFFLDGEITAKKMRKAILFARQELEAVENTYKRAGWENVYGSSGTIQTVRDIINNQANGELNITHSGLQNLKEEIIAAGHSNNLKYEALSGSRVPVFAGGVAILCATFEALNIQSMNVSSGALREGLLLDLIGRQQNQDTREKTVDELISRYNIDNEHASRVEQTARILFDQVRKDWGLDKKTDLKLLRWAAKLHEIGLAIAHSQHHKHAAYLISNSELAGFSREEQLQLATLIRAHRRKFPVEELQLLQDESRARIFRLTTLLRVAVLLNRARTSTTNPELKISTKDNQLEINFPDEWLVNHPLTEADLATEADYLKAIDILLAYK